ncbi:adenosylmethionine decarboxylase [Desulfurobacterium atlanticum]|uniref:S-adenosylmethionine decarboxylase proenzyme n=1 Tax=Desulfurobacterium atlanticum TaxID=240169 RepID=A0A238ZFS8_9BACT|nr:adenosylmethionine decarboxylase [Desulfurobacterium atlanticum]SNR82130.1 S-adenosylmethionine decarboxylase [Desulfurobacterium atlanticum]
MAKTLGVHIVADMYGCDPEILKSADRMAEIFEGAVKEANLNKLSSHFHQFYPHGATGVIVISESHLSFHTWPEHGYVAIDVYTCGDHSLAFKAFDYIMEKLNPERVEKEVHFRGVIDESEEVEFASSNYSVEA